MKTIQNTGSRFPFSSGPDSMNSRSLYMTLAASAILAYACTLILYASTSSNPLTSRLGYAFLVSVVPAVGVLAVLKLTKLLVSRLGVVIIYAVLFVLILLLQALGRQIPVYS